MIVPSAASFVLFLLPLISTANVIAPKPILHIIEDVTLPRRDTDIRQRNPVSNGVLNATATATTTSVPSSITPFVQTSPWPSYSRPWPATNCDKYTSAATASYSSDWCRVALGTVKLHYWPTSSTNLTYPSTSYLPEYDLVMTRPSVYLIVDSVIASDACHQLLGPVQTNFIYSAPLSAISTLQPVIPGTGTRIGGPKQLALNDLGASCSTVTATQYKNNQNYVDDPCHPILDYTIDMKNKVAFGAWASCGRHAGGDFGLFDPPVPVAPCSGGDCGDEGAKDSTPVTPVTTTSAPEPTQQREEEHPQPSTSFAEPSPTVASIPAETSVPVTTSAEPVPEESPVIPSSPDAPVDISTDTTSSAAILTSSPTLPPTPVAIATLPNSIVISAAPGGSHVVIGTQSLTSGAPAITIPGGDLASIEPSGNIVVSNTDNGVVVTYSPPAPAPTHDELANSQPLAAIPIGTTAAIIENQTVKLGGAAITLSGAKIASMGTAGLVVQAPSGSITTVSILPSITGLPDSVPNTDSSPAPVVTDSPGQLQGESDTGVQGDGSTSESQPLPAAGDGSLPTSTTNGYVAATGTGLGSIIYTTFEGSGYKSTDIGIIGWLGCLVFGVLVVGL